MGRATSRPNTTSIVFALFTMLATLTGDSSGWMGRTMQKAFVQAMFDSPSGHFWTGTSDPTHIFFDNSPEDVNTWSYLAMRTLTTQCHSTG